MRRTIIGTLVVLRATGGGCAPEPQTVLTYPAPPRGGDSGGGGARLTEAGGAGLYTLHPCWADGRHALRVEHTCLAAGDALGFARGGDGRLYAVTGAMRKPLDEGQYAWEYHPPDRARPVREALETAIFVAEIPLIYALLIVAPGIFPRC
jgi:hypothetical protein